MPVVCFTLALATTLPSPVQNNCSPQWRVRLRSHPAYMTRMQTEMLVLFASLVSRSPSLPANDFDAAGFDRAGLMVRIHAQSGTWIGCYKPLLAPFPRLPFLGVSLLANAKTGWLTSILPSGNAILATFFFRYWHWMFIFTAWSSVITIIHQLEIHNLSIQSTLLTVLGIVLGCTSILFHLPGNPLTNHTPQS